MFILPANLSASLQPLDVDFFNPLKRQITKDLTPTCLEMAPIPSLEALFGPGYNMLWHRQHRSVKFEEPGEKQAYGL